MKYQTILVCVTFLLGMAAEEDIICTTYDYSSEICLMKLSSKTLQTLPYFWNFFFSFLISSNSWLLIVDALVYADIDEGARGIHCLKSKVAQNKKIKKTYFCFLIPRIWQILKHFAKQFHQAQTSYFWRVPAYFKSYKDIANF